MKNLSNSNATEVSNVPVHESEHALEHGDIITSGEMVKGEELFEQLQCGDRVVKVQTPCAAKPLQKFDFYAW